MHAGHVLVAPTRLAPRMADLSVEEVSDLFSLAQCVGAKIEKHYNAEALTFTVQVCSFAQYDRWCKQHPYRTCAAFQMLLRSVTPDAP